MKLYQRGNGQTKRIYIMNTLTVNTKKLGTITFKIQFNKYFTALRVLNEQEDLILSACLEETCKDYFCKKLKTVLIEAYTESSRMAAIYLADGDVARYKGSKVDIKKLEEIMRCKEVSNILESSFSYNDVDNLIN